MEKKAAAASRSFPGKTGASGTRRKRYFVSLCLVACMAAAADLLGEKEVIFPEAAALAVGWWIVDKRVWRVNACQLAGLLTAGATAGVCIVRYSPGQLPVNLCLAFVFAAVCLMLTRCTLIPLVSACMLPVLMGTESWVYPVSVAGLSAIFGLVRRGMERAGWRQPDAYGPPAAVSGRELGGWCGMLVCVAAVAFLAAAVSAVYLVLPPLVVTFVEFVRSKAGFRNRPVQVVGLLTGAAGAGTLCQWVEHDLWGWPEWAVALTAFGIMLVVFERIGKFFAPAAAVSLVPLVVPREALPWLPVQVAAGSVLLVAAALVCFYRCYKWPKAQLVYCLMPVYWRKRMSRKKGAPTFDW